MRARGLRSKQRSFGKITIIIKILTIASSFCSRRLLLASSPSLEEGGTWYQGEYGFRIIAPCFFSQHDRQFSERLVECVDTGILSRHDPQHHDPSFFLDGMNLVSLFSDGHELLTCSVGMIGQAEIDANLRGRN
ncbi:hypothetical protein C8J56DRAFT_1174809 [Mycena floridula]|nr:hypothetical protein C8J56DRAFT_1174809 [Mycena floridula]